MRYHSSAVAVVVLALLACKQLQKEESEKPAAAPTPTAPPPSAAPAPTATASAAAKPEPEPEPEPEEVPLEPEKDKRGLITVKGVSKKPPTTADWDAVGEITVIGSSSLGCETKVARGWFRCSCRGSEVQNLIVLTHKGITKGEIMTYNAPGVASVVLPLKNPVKAEVGINFTFGSRKLTVNYPHGMPNPEITLDRGR